MSTNTASALVADDADELSAAAPDLPPQEPSAPASPVSPEAKALVSEDTERVPGSPAPAPAPAPQEQPKLGRPKLPDTPERLKWRESKKKTRNIAKPVDVEAVDEPAPSFPPTEPGGSPTPAPGNPIPTPPGMSQVINYDKMAMMLVRMTTGLAANVIGPEWRPQVFVDPESKAEVNEESMLVEATASYLRAKQAPDLPPGYMLLAVVAMYAAPRFTQPSTRQKVSWLWQKIKNFFGFLRGARRVEVARHD